MRTENQISVSAAAGTSIRICPELLSSQEEGVKDGREAFASTHSLVLMWTAALVAVFAFVVLHQLWDGGPGTDFSDVVVETAKTVTQALTKRRLRAQGVGCRRKTAGQNKWNSTSFNHLKRPGSAATWP